MTGFQNGANALNENGFLKESVGQGLSKDAQLSGRPLPLIFSQILKGQGEASTLSKQLQGIVSTRIQEDVVSPVLSGRHNSENSVALEIPETADQLVSDSQISVIPTPAEITVLSSPVVQGLAEAVESLQNSANGVLQNRGLPVSAERPPPASLRQDIAGQFTSSGSSQMPFSKNFEVSVFPQTVFQGSGEKPSASLVNREGETLAESDRLNPTKFRDVSLNGPNAFMPKEASTPLPVLLTAVSPIEGLPIPANDVLHNRGVQANAEHSSLGYVRQDVVGESTPAGISKVPLLKGFEAEVHPQTVFQGSGEKPSASLVNREGETLARTFLPTGKEVSAGPELTEHSTFRNERVRPSTLPLSSSTLPAQSSPELPQHTPPVTALHPKGPVGFTDPVSASPASIKPILGNPAVLKDALGVVNEHRATVPVDRHEESGVFGKVEHAQNILETSVKTVGLDPNGGQGLGSGMNHSQNSQPGFQQPSSFPGQGSGQGVGLRGFEERGLELPPPALQRLQMDVQLSENQRVQIDIGVQNRQVYAGLVMDHSVLRNLAVQFVPQLENQLTEVDLELQEFSAEVREEREQDADSLFHDRQSHDPQESPGRSHGERRSVLNALHRSEERGLHLVA